MPLPKLRLVQDCISRAVCVQDAGTNHVIGLSDGETQRDKCTQVWALHFLKGAGE